MAGTEFRHAHGQIAITVQALVIDLDMTGTVHGLDGVGAVFRLCNEHILHELVRVPGFLPQADIHDFGCIDFQVTGFTQSFTSPETVPNAVEQIQGGG